MNFYFQELFYVYFGLVALLGLCVGSFLNVVIYRLPNKISLNSPPSHCPKCQTKIKWYDNIPLLSYIILGAKCRGCKTHISLRYPLVELLNCLLWSLSFLFFGRENLAYALLSLPLFSCLICVAFIDLDCGIIMDRFNIIIALISVAACFFDSSISLLDRGLTLLGTVALLGLLILCFKVFAKKDALGWGDVKLLAAIAPLLGFKKMFFALFLASVVASIILLILIAKNKDDKDKEYPFAPYLVLGLTVAVLAGDFIINFYQNLFF